MTEHELHIRNMVCPRCISVVTQELERLKLPVLQVVLGEVRLARAPTAEELSAVRKALQEHGFELLEDKKAELVERIKLLIIELIRSGKVEHLQVNISDYLAAAIGRDYGYLSSVFSAEEGITVAKFVVLQKVERVKELMAYNELSLSQIAYLLGYSSVAHLSNQFKQVMGASPSEYKRSRELQRKPLDQVQ